MNAVGSNRRRLTPEKYNVTEYCWSPDGSKIAFASSHGVFVVNSDGSDLHALHRTIWFWLFHGVEEPCWSPDGNWVAYIYWTGGEPGDTTTRIYAASADGTSRKMLAKSEDFVTHDLDW